MCDDIIYRLYHYHTSVLFNKLYKFSILTIKLRLSSMAEAIEIYEEIEQVLKEICEKEKLIEFIIVVADESHPIAYFSRVPLSEDKINEIASVTSSIKLGFKTLLEDINIDLSKQTEKQTEDIKSVIIECKDSLFLLYPLPNATILVKAKKQALIATLRTLIKYHLDKLNRCITNLVLKVREEIPKMSSVMFQS